METEGEGSKYGQKRGWEKGKRNTDDDGKMVLGISWEEYKEEENEKNRERKRMTVSRLHFSGHYKLSD